MGEIEVALGDITKLKVDAMVDGKGTSVEKVVFVCFSKADFDVYGRMLGLVKEQ